ncbi:MAG TPA: TIGR04282 family arsenosugar biosynthesis glycosyltransferase [Candidatus Acidoferrales bacterium]|nr:TIGR04282 family arsenosugar biosynthesis glycosyltransferase [Candidatus Acidoferrales bacterium]
MPTADNALVILTKFPEPGQSKTRLVPPLSSAEAAELAHALLLDQLQNLVAFNAAQLFIAFTPPGKANFFEALLPGQSSCFPQQGESLGDRMRHAFDVLFSRGFKRVLLIGGDLPAVPLKTLTDAIAAFERDSEIVLGPASDGGYYLVAMNRPFPEIFAGMSWSQPDVLAATIAKLISLNRKFKLISPWYDIDTIDDLSRLNSDCAAAPAGFMENTKALLQKFKQGGKLI